MYTVNETVVTESTQTYISAGISEVELSHRFAYSPEKNNPFLEYCYTNELGQIVKRTEWEVGKPRPVGDLSDGQVKYFTNKAALFTEWDVKRAEKEQRAPIVYDLESAMQHQYELDLASQKKRIMKVAELFVKTEDLYGEFKSFEEFAQHVSIKIGDLSKGVKLRVKFVYAYDGYINTPQGVKASEPWIERVDAVPADKSQIKILSNDKMEPTRNNGSGTRAPGKINPLGDDSSMTSPSGEKDDLPF